MNSYLLVDFSCALKVSTPVAYLSTIKSTLDQQIVIKSSEVLDTYSEITAFLFDKTGTITTSHPAVAKVIPFDGYCEEDVIRIGACLEEHIHHPIASALVLKADEDAILHEEMHDQLNYIANKGIKSTIDKEPVVIGSYILMQDEGISITDEQQVIIRKYRELYNLLFLGHKRKLIAIFCIDTPLRKDTAEVLDYFKKQGKELVLVTGDTLERTKAVVQELTFDRVYTNLKSEEKYEIIQTLQKKQKKVLMVGDELNDSAAISLADIGVVMNDSADISKQMSDIILKNETLSSFIALTDLSENLQQLIKRNVKETIVINSSLIGLGVFNLLPPSSLSFLHNLTTLKIILHSLNLGQ